MAQINPFPCLRPDPQYASQVAALPYDVYTREEARKAVDGHPLSFLNIDRPETQFDQKVSTYDPCVYEKAAELLTDRIREQVYLEDSQSCYYVYQLIRQGQPHTGLVACVSVDDYLQGIIRKHENTVEAKEEDRIRHVDALSAQTGPIFLAYRHNQVIGQSMHQAMEQDPLYDFCSEDGIIHRVWKISEEGEINKIHQAFLDISRIYIADGHHRCASAVKVATERRARHPDYTGRESFNYILSVLFQEEELTILPYNRGVKNLGGLSSAKFFKRVSQNFILEEVLGEMEPKKKGEFGMCLEGRWYRLTPRKEVHREDPVENLDVSILQRELLEPILGIRDPRTDKRIRFVGGTGGAKEITRCCKEDLAVGFTLYPTSIKELFQVADEGRLMPPKSTWFEPKLRSGLFIHPFER